MSEKEISAAVDAIFKGKAFGGVASRLLQSGMNANALRTNDTLRKDEWKHFDEAVVKISQQRLVGVNDLISRGLFLNIENGLGTTVLQYETESDIEPAEINMTGSSRPASDRPTYDIASLPLPIVHKGFQLNIRVLNASRKLGQPLDTTLAQMSARKVAEKIEEILFVGASTYTFGGGTLYGYVDHPQANSVTLSIHWDASSKTGALILADVIAMKQASIDDRHYGPWMLYVPAGYETVLDEDYSTSYPNVTIRDRIKRIGGIEDVKVVDKLTADTVVLVEMQPETARMVIGLQPTTLQWDTEGGMVNHFKVMAIMVPQIRADQDLRSGIAVLS